MTVQPGCMCDCFSHFQAHGCRRTAVILTRNKNAWTNTSSSLSVILWQHQCTHTHLFLCKSAENENILKSKHKHTHTHLTVITIRSIWRGKTTSQDSITSQEKSLVMAFSLVVTSPSYGPKCIPGDTTGP